jgi:hypothetical protein
MEPNMTIRKAVIEVGAYTVKEAPTGGWRVFATGGTEPISIHDNKGSAVAAAMRYAQRKISKTETAAR